MTTKSDKKKAQELRAIADRMEASVSSGASPSSQEWVSPERVSHYYQMADEKRREADLLDPPQKEK